MKVNLQKGMPHKPAKKAMEVIGQWANGEVRATKLWNQKRNKDVLKLDIGRDWRAVTQDDGETWDVMSHEKYSSKFM
ncbi:MAG: hypothetical protein ACRC47_08590 [Shewanella sp.]